MTISDQLERAIVAREGLWPDGPWHDANRRISEWRMKANLAITCAGLSEGRNPAALSNNAAIALMRKIEAGDLT